MGTKNLKSLKKLLTGIAVLITGVSFLTGCSKEYDGLNEIDEFLIKTVCADDEGCKITLGEKIYINDKEEALALANGLKNVIRLDNGLDDFTFPIANEWADDLVIYNLAQIHEGIPVYGRCMTITVDKKGLVTDIYTNAHNISGSFTYNKDDIPDGKEVMIYDIGTNATLVYAASNYEESESGWDYTGEIIDINTGKVLDRWNDGLSTG